MPIPLSRNTRRLADILLSDSDRDRICHRLKTECAEDIPMWHENTPEGMERIRFAVLRLISRNPKNEELAFNHAKMDLRDLFIAAGFAESTTEHKQWFTEVTKRANK